MLLPEPGPVDADLVTRYDWPRDRWVRASMVMSLDGAVVGPDGLSRSISSAGDRRVFAAGRALADAYLVGARTVRVEQYRPVRARAELRSIRAERGQLPAPRLAVVSSTCLFDWPNAAWVHSDERPLVLTVEAADPALRAEAARLGCDVVVAGEVSVHPADAISELAARGLTRVTCEGGPGLLRQIVAADLLDEVDLTLAPALTNAEAPASPGPALMAVMRLAQLLEEDGFLFARYVRDRDRGRLGPEADDVDAPGAPSGPVPAGAPIAPVDVGAPTRSVAQGPPPVSTPGSASAAARTDGAAAPGVAPS